MKQKPTVEQELTVEQCLAIAQQVGYIFPYHFTNTNNPVDFPTTEIDTLNNGDAAELESGGCL